MPETTRSAPAAASLAALSHDLMAAVEPDGRIAWANPSWRRLLGWAPEELAGAVFAELFDEADGVSYVCGRGAAQTAELEHELRAAEDRFRALTEATPEAICVADGRGRI